MNKNELVLNKIREINNGRPAQQGELMKAVGVEHDEIVAILNSLYDSGEISAKPRESHQRGEFKNLDFREITANN